MARQDLPLQIAVTLKKFYDKLNTELPVDLTLVALIVKIIIASIN